MKSDEPGVKIHGGEVNPRRSDIRTGSPTRGPGNDLPVSIALLAAGESARFGSGHKLLARLGERTIIEHSILRAGSTACHELLVVADAAGSEIETVVRTELERWTRRPIPRCLFNDDFGSGMAGSIVSAVRAAASGTGILIWPGDMPLIDPASVEKILAERAHSSIVVPVFEGRRGHPVFFGPDFRTDLLELRGDTGARSVVEANPDAVVEVRVDDPGVVLDIDTEEDLEKASSTGLIRSTS